MEKENKLITAERVTLAFDGLTAAENVNFSLARGEYLCVIGENGSGKSTLLRAITGEVKPAAGKLILAEELRQNGIGYLPQKSHIQKDFPASVYEVVLSGCTGRDPLGLFWSRRSKAKAAEAMELLKIADLRDKCYGELSGGQQQRVLLARAICASDTLLLLDEPVTGLDPEAAHEMYHSIRRIHRELSCAVMMVSHDVSCALHEAQTVLSMCRGHSFFGTVEEYHRHEELDKAQDDLLHDCSCCKEKKTVRVDHACDCDHHHGEEA